MCPKVQLLIYVTREHAQRRRGLTPPDVGAAEPNSAIDIPMQRMNRLATAHFRYEMR